MVNSTRTGQPVELWWMVHGLILVGTAVSVGVQRLPTRPSVVLGTLLAFLAALGIEVCRVAAEMDASISLMVGVVGVMVFMLGLAPTTLLTGALGGWIGSRFVRTDGGPAVESESAPEHLRGRMRERYDATRIVHATLEGRGGRLGTMESTVAFAWVEEQMSLDDLEREELRWRGIEVEPLAELVDGRVPPSKVRARLLEETRRVLEGLEQHRTRPCYR